MNKIFYSHKLAYRITRHILFFLVIVLIFTFILQAQNNQSNFSNTLFIVSLNALLFFGYAYISIFVLIPELLLNNRYFWFILLFSLIGIGLSAIKLLLSDFIFYSLISPENIEKSGIINLRFILVNTKDMSFIVALFCVAKYAKDYLHDDRLTLELKLRNKEAQNKLLQSQFDSHFLFNTINNLYAISLLEPDKTLRVISRLKSLLHYIIDESQKQFISISQEVDLLHNYIQLEKLRYGERLKIKFDRRGDFNEVKIPPMILFVLVENCFKHGSSLDAGNPWIKLELHNNGHKLLFITENSLPAGNIPHLINNKVGASLKNLRERLKILYDKNFLLHTEENESFYKVKLEIKID